MNMKIMQEFARAVDCDQSELLQKMFDALRNVDETVIVKTNSYVFAIKAYHVPNQKKKQVRLCNLEEPQMLLDFNEDLTDLDFDKLHYVISYNKAASASIQQSAAF